MGQHVELIERDARADNRIDSARDRPGMPRGVQRVITPSQGVPRALAQCHAAL